MPNHDYQLRKNRIIKTTTKTKENCHSFPELVLVLNELHELYHQMNPFQEIISGAEIIILKSPRKPSPISSLYKKRQEVEKKLPFAQSRSQLDKEEEKAHPNCTKQLQLKKYF